MLGITSLISLLQIHECQNHIVGSNDIVDIAVIALEVSLTRVGPFDGWLPAHIFGVWGQSDAVQRS